MATRAFYLHCSQPFLATAKFHKGLYFMPFGFLQLHFSTGTESAWCISYQMFYRLLGKKLKVLRWLYRFRGWMQVTASGVYLSVIDAGGGVFFLQSLSQGDTSVMISPAFQPGPRQVARHLSSFYPLLSRYHWRAIGAFYHRLCNALPWRRPESFLCGYGIICRICGRKA